MSISGKRMEEQKTEEISQHFLKNLEDRGIQLTLPEEFRSL
jgi:hypothetical protein